ncbi:helix-turn-helix domain-containing protein [Rhodococcus sp. IEGM 1379]|uniref:winged helix-turn-helix domain-containing protein n=1 Tax=Rhodococcus sp. IEGM 1379 TaxID=3047086 RepID=UPI0024B7BFF8|nr:helix-turn-helix domain-containing protein [Rhodococcus sp. IEGM 1379]MDI9915811.1 helix-turn-helix domain-containing protein [Rhodococcus sp. IEGM 1379]
MFAVAVIDRPAAAETSLGPLRQRTLAAPVTPTSAAALAPLVGLTRQKVNYHLRTLEEHGLVQLVEERKRGNMTERVMQASAASYVISTAAMSALAPDPSRFPDQLSAPWLVSLAARIVREVGELMSGATAPGKPLASYAIDSEITFANAADRAAVAGDLGEAHRFLPAQSRPVPAVFRRAAHHLCVG